MMRKDVKLGFAIGGVLLAVVVVYVLVGTGGNDRNAAGTATVVTEDVNGTSAAASKNIDASSTATTADSRGGVVVSPTTPTASNASNTTSTTTPPAPSQVASAEQPKRDANGDLWGKALNEGQLLMTETPTPANGVSARTNNRTSRDTAARDAGGSDRARGESSGSSSDRSSTSSANGSTTASSKTSSDDTMNPSSSSSASPINPPTTDVPTAPIADVPPARAIVETGGSPSTRPSDSIAGDSRTSPQPIVGRAGSIDRAAASHTIQKGETLALISQAAYGNANYYPHILRANPGLVAEKLKPGMIINLPPMSTVKPSPANDPTTTAASPAVAAATADPRTQYKVESGDSLYRIAVKLYNKPEMADKLYELNKDAIGADRAKLKLHAILKLPEPPTATASR